MNLIFFNSAFDEEVLVGQPMISRHQEEKLCNFIVERAFSFLDGNHTWLHMADVAYHYIEMEMSC
jgi:hypothetical protein